MSEKYSKKSTKTASKSKKSAKNSTKSSNYIIKSKSSELEKEAKQIYKAVKNFKFSTARLVLFLVIVAVTLFVGFVFKAPIEKSLNKVSIQNVDTSTIDMNGLVVHFVDVGQGDSIAIKFPDGKKMLIDAGTSKSKNNLVNYLKNNFFENGDDVFDYVLLTHSDADHCGGMVAVCENFVIDKIYRPCMCSKYVAKSGAVLLDETNGNRTNKNVCDSATYYKTIMAFNSEIDSNGNSAKVVWTKLDDVNSTERIFGEGYSIDFYAPTSTFITQSAGTVDNDFSPIMCLNYNGKKLMFTGDASTTSEELAMQNATLPDVDLLKVGHHGSKTSSGQQFLNQIKPEIAVICVGEGNSYHHPTTEALNRLASVNAEIYRTDKNGTVVANVTSGANAELNMFVGEISQNAVYIHIEYLMSGIVIVAVGLCFGIKIKTKNN